MGCVGGLRDHSSIYPASSPALPLPLPPARPAAEACLLLQRPAPCRAGETGHPSPHIHPPPLFPGLQHAFQQTGLTQVTIPDSVTSIGGVSSMPVLPLWICASAHSRPLIGLVSAVESWRIEGWAVLGRCGVTAVYIPPPRQPSLCLPHQLFVRRRRLSIPRV